jgi:anti-anti-sigma regulatory factor
MRAFVGRKAGASFTTLHFRFGEPVLAAAIVDLAGLEFIDSSGVAALARGRDLARQAGGELLLAAPQQQVLRVRTLTRLGDAFPLHATVAEAAGRSRRMAAVPVLPRRPSLASWPRRHAVSSASPGREAPSAEEAGRSSGSVTRDRRAEPVSILDGLAFCGDRVPCYTGTA